MTARDEVDWKRKAGELRERADRLHRSVLEPDVLQRSQLLRAGTLATRSALPEVRERERRFALASPAYAAAIDAGDAVLARMLRRITVDGLNWWVPLLRPGDPAEVERAIGHQDFPYRVIAQTRELALGGAMLDLGANVGRMCIPRVILGDVTTAYCVEPDPLNYECFVRNIRDNRLRGLILPDRVAVGGTTGAARFARTRTAGGHRVIGRSVVTRHETIEVPMVTLDEWVDRLSVDPDLVVFIKMDVQGSEVAVLKGAARMLAHRHIAWQIEVDPHLLQAGGSSVADLFAILQRHFTHFIDLSRDAVGPRVREVGELPDALACISGVREARTDILVCTLASRGGR
jgi:FkbM family methyltransferase